jgi:hypothetical protein
VGSSEEWRREEVGGNGIIWSAVARFKVVDEDHLRRHPQAAHTPYEERMAKKTDRHGEREREAKSKVAAEKEVIGLLGGLSHPNLPTFFSDPRPSSEVCLYSLWEENSSLRRYL